MKLLTEQQFIDVYCGDNLLMSPDDSEVWDATYFDEVKRLSGNGLQVFTVTEGDDGESQFIGTGFHIVNRLGYIVSKVIVEDPDNFPGAVWYEDEKDDFTFIVNGKSYTEHAFHPEDAWEYVLMEYEELDSLLPMPEYTSRKGYEPPQEREMEFTVRLVGRGISRAMAWDDAVSAFCADPSYPDDKDIQEV